MQMQLYFQAVKTAYRNSACVLSSTPIILLDEPTSALDQTNATRIILELSHLAKNQNKTIVMVTHDLALAAHADNRLVLKNLTDSGKSL